MKILQKNIERNTYKKKLRYRALPLSIFVSLWRNFPTLRKQNKECRIRNLKASKLGEGKREGLRGVLKYKGTKENIVGNKKHEGTLDRKIKPLQIFFEGAVDGGRRWQRNILHREQIRKNCGNVGAQGNFGREQGNKDHPRIPSKAVILDK